MKSPIHCLVLQLGRGSDLLQSLVALKAARQLYPSMEITLVCRETFASLVSEVDWIREVIELPTRQWLGPALSGKADAESLLPVAAQWVSPLASRNWDLLVNWSYSEPSSFLTALIPAKVKLGYDRQKDLSFSSGDTWSQFFQAYIQGGVPQNIHVTDLFTTQLLTALQLHHGDPVDAGHLAVTGRDFFSGIRTAGDRLLDPARSWVGIQLDSVFTARQWATLAELLLERHPEVQVVLLGDAHRRELARDTSQLVLNSGQESRRLLNLVGETELDLWVDSVSQCRWIITATDLPAQLASILGTRVLRMDTQCDSSWIQGAYGNGHALVSPTEKDVPLVPEAVYAAWTYAHYEWSHRRKWSFEAHLDRLGFSSLEPWLEFRTSRIRATDDGGGVVYESEFNRPMSSREWLATVNGQIARLLYCGWNAPIGFEIERRSISPTLLQDLRALDESSSVLIRVGREAVRSAGELHQKTSQLKAAHLMSLDDRNELQAAGGRILELQSLVDRLAAADPHLEGFSNLLKVLMHNLEGGNVAEVSRNTGEAWSQIERGVELMRQWIRHTLELARPKPVAVEPFQPIP